MIAALGCNEPLTSHDAHNAAGHSNHVDTPEQSSRIVIDSEKSNIVPGVATKLRFHLEGSGEAIIDKLQPLHEKLVHLIVVREGLDHFDHVHPTVDAEGMMSVDVTFPVAGNYFLYADYQPMNGTPSLAKAIVNVPGASKEAETLQPNRSPAIVVDDLHATVDVERKAGEALVTFQLQNRDNKPIDDLQPYLGAMGHLVVISADGKEYVHAHPVGGTTPPHDGKVSFGAHFPNPGIYKMWGQFQRNDEIITIQFVVNYQL